MKQPTIAELRKELSDMKTPSLTLGYKDCDPNHYRVLSENLERALRPLNHAYDALVIPGWERGILPAKSLRAWLPFAPSPILDIEVRPDCLIVTGERTRATFKVGAYAPIVKKATFEHGQYREAQNVNLLVKCPFAFQLLAPGARPTRSELMTVLNKKRAEILRLALSMKADLPLFSEQYRAGRLEVIERDAKSALAALYRAFGRMQSKTWTEWAVPGYKENNTYLSAACLSFWRAVSDFRDAHEVTRQLHAIQIGVNENAAVLTNIHP
jgi:hypothetical protein